MDLATLAGVNYREFRIAGQTYRVYETRLRHWAELQAYLKVEAPGPISCLRAEDMAGLDAETRRTITLRAYEEARQWPPRIGSPGWFAAIDRAPRGNAELVRAVLKRGHPDLTPEQVDELADALDLPTILEMVVAALGADPSPKSPAPAVATPAAPGPASRRRRRRR